MIDDRPRPDGEDLGDLFTAATLLARRGRYGEALGLLPRALRARHCSEVEALDLQARICAQQGLYRQAEQCWLRASALEGSSAAFARELDELWRFARSPSRILPLSLLAAAAVALVSWQLGRSAADGNEHRARTESSLSVIGKNLDATRAQAGEYKTQQDMQLAALAAALRDLEKGIGDRFGRLATRESISDERKAAAIGFGEALVPVTGEVRRLRVEIVSLQHAVRSLSSTPSATEEVHRAIAALEKKLIDMFEEVKRDRSHAPPPP